LHRFPLEKVSLRPFRMISSRFAVRLST
jgi:hypothetical protein